MSRMNSKSVSIGVTILTAAALFAAQPVVAQTTNNQKPSTQTFIDGASSRQALAKHFVAIGNEGTHIVVLKPGSDLGLQVSKVKRWGAKLTYRFNKTIKGFAGDFTPKQLLALRANPAVAYVERNAQVSINDTAGNETVGDLWGLDRIDQEPGLIYSDLSGGLDGQYHYDSTAPDVYAYVIDTGILSTHTEFGSRVTSGASFIKGQSSTQDCNGHGTHVAGTIGGEHFGVAKAVHLVPVRVLNCKGSGSNAGVIAGMDWVANNHVANKSVANMSLGGGFSQAVNDSAAALVESGVVLVVAAGNESSDVSSHSPASAAAAITVAASTFRDVLASYSNYGSGVDLAAPGSAILSSVSSSTTATDFYSGTSMASPHVAAAAALLLQAGTTPANVDDALLANAKANAIGASAYSEVGKSYPLLQTRPTSSVVADSPGVALPGKPTSPVAVSSRKAAVSLSWSDSGGASSQHWVYAYYGSTFGIFVVPGSSTGVKLSLAGVSAGTSVKFKVVAFNRAGHSAFSVESNAVTVR